MPYILITTENIETGEISVYDASQDHELIEYLRESFGTPYPGSSVILGQPVNVLNAVEGRGYRVISTAVQGNTIIWTLHK